jgi:hypothetical protein
LVWIGEKHFLIMRGEILMDRRRSDILINVFDSKERK